MSLFNTEGRLYKTLAAIANALALNFFWILFSIPIVSAGAATVAAHSCALKILDGKEGYIFKDFAKAFRENFRQGTILHLAFSAALYASYLDIQILSKGDPPIPFVIASVVGIAFAAFSFLYAFPLCARYENKVFLHVKNSFLLSARHFWTSLFVLLALFAEGAIFLWNTKTLILLALFGPASAIFTVAAGAKKIFQKNDQMSNAKN